MVTAKAGKDAAAAMDSAANEAKRKDFTLLSLQK
jgi:hypothetical protein